MLRDYIDDLPEDVFRALGVLDCPIKANEFAKDYLSADEEGRTDIRTFFDNPVIKDFIDRKERMCL